MTVRPIVVVGEPVLHRGAGVVTQFDDDLAALVEDMWATLEASGGVGLAAPQIGVGLRVFVYDLRGMQMEHSGCVVNPVLQLGKVSKEPPDPHDDSEGCLSVPGLHFPLRRADWVKLDGFDATGERVSLEANGFHARCLQHETDHLNGRLYLDRLDPTQAKKAKRAVKRNGWGRPGTTWLPGVDPDPFAADDD